MAESGGSLRGPLPRLLLQMNAKHALPSLPPQEKKKLGGKQLSSSGDSPGLKAAASTLWGGGGEGHGHCLQAACLALPFAQPPGPGALTADPSGGFPASPMQRRSQDPLVPRVDKDFSSQVGSAASPSECWVSPLRYYFKKASDEFACGAVFEEVWDDEVVLPMYEGRILGKVERID